MLRIMKVNLSDTFIAITRNTMQYNIHTIDAFHLLSYRSYLLTKLWNNFVGNQSSIICALSNDFLCGYKGINGLPTLWKRSKTVLGNGIVIT